MSYSVTKYMNISTSRPSSEISSQVPIVEADNTAQYWPKLGSQLSAIVIGPVSPFASMLGRRRRPLSTV